MGTRENNVEIFNDTNKMCKSDNKLKASIRHSTDNQKLILEYEELAEVPRKLYDREANIVVSKKRTIEAAESYRDTKVAILNFASASNPGGGVTSGSRAQEECICRISTLYFCLNTPDMWAGFYTPHRAAHNPIHNDDIIFTPGVVVFKSDDDSPKIRSEKEWFNVDVITCAAPNLREKPSNKYNSGDGQVTVKLTNDELRQIHEKKLRRILDVALLNGAESIILGAFGCGAFMNPPEVVATAIKNVIQDYKQAFKNIEFAIYCGNDDRNYRVFKEKLL